MRLVVFVSAWVLGVAMLLVSHTPGMAQSARSDGAIFQKVIKGQMSAFARGDAAAAFSFATPDIQRQFQSPDIFMQMVKQGYQPVYRPRDVTFGTSRVTSRGPVQEVFVTGPKGGSWLALYSFEQHGDGSWRISGCYLTKSSGFAA